MGSSAAAGRREIVHLRRKNGDAVLCLRVRARDPAVEREQSEIWSVYRNWRVSTDSPQRVRKNGNAPAAGDGSGRRREGGEIGEGSRLPLRSGQGGASGERALACGRAEPDSRDGKEFFRSGELWLGYFPGSCCRSYTGG